jgi:hypothetical protein
MHSAHTTMDASSAWLDRRSQIALQPLRTTRRCRACVCSCASYVSASPHIGPIGGGKHRNQSMPSIMHAYGSLLTISVNSLLPHPHIHHHPHTPSARTHCSTAHVCACTVTLHQGAAHVCNNFQSILLHSSYVSADRATLRMHPWFSTA